MLIGHARAAAREAGHRAILLCGDPLYYARVGFTAAEDFGIRTSENQYFAALHACPLYTGKPWPTQPAVISKMKYTMWTKQRQGLLMPNSPRKNGLPARLRSDAWRKWRRC